MRTICILVLGLMLAITPSLSATAGPLEDLEAAMLAGEYARAVSIAEQLVADHPESSLAAWHLGCALSRAERPEEAVASLLRSAELGFSGTRSVHDDDDLDPIRTHPEFPRVVAAVAAAAERRLAAFKEHAAEAKPTVILPPGHDPERPAPLLLVLHGTGGNGKTMAAAWREVARRRGAIVVAPDAIRPAGGGDGDGFSWTYRDESEWYVLELVRQARERWAIDRVVLAGFSQGANIALMLGQSHPAVFDAVIPVGGHYEADTATVPSDDPRPRWALLIGADDPWAATYEEARRVFTAAGMTVRHEAIPGLGHAFPTGRDRGALASALAWALEAQLRAEQP